jgi:hypothetical protein
MVSYDPEADIKPTIRSSADAPEAARVCMIASTAASIAASSASSIKWP